MSHGRLIALDTPENIKKHFGVGYNLIIEHRDAGKAGSTLQNIR
jgi:hypothetical protein